MSKPSREWVLEITVLAIHDEQLAEHGGIAGIRDIALIQSALARPQHLEVYGTPDLADLAASYAFGLAKNHAFLDGNKRTAYVVARTFLILNGYDLAAPPDHKVAVMVAVSDGSLSEAQLAEWFRSRISAMPD